MSARSDKGRLDGLIVAAVFAAIGLAALWLFVRVAEPVERQPRPPAASDYSEADLMAVLSTNGFEARLADLDRAGRADGERSVGRLTGGPGCRRAEEMIRRCFEQAGLEVTTQGFRAVVPATQVCELLDESGRPLPDVTLYPFVPAGIMPLALPEGGVSGRLLEIEDMSLRRLQGCRPEDTLALTWLQNGGGWRTLAGVGVRALLVREDEVTRALQADPDQPASWQSGALAEESDFPVLLARGPIERYAGQRLTIRCRAVWEEKPARNVIGVLRGAAGASEALVVSCYYDSNSLVPELAPGAEQAISVAAMMEYVRAMAPYRGALRRDVIFVATAGHAQALGGVSRLLEGLEAFRGRSREFQPLEDRLAEQRTMLARVSQGRAVLETMARATGNPEAAAAFRREYSARDAAFRDWFGKAFRTVAGEVHLARREEMLTARLAYLRAGSPAYRDGFDPLAADDARRKDPANSHPLLRAYLAAKQEDNRAANLMSVPLWNLVLHPAFPAWGFAARAQEQMRRLEELHARQMGEIEDMVRVRDLFAAYRSTLGINLELNSGGKAQKTDLAVLVGIGNIGTVVQPQVGEVAQLLQEKAPRGGDAPGLGVVQWAARDASGSKERPNLHSPASVELESEPWFLCGRLAFTVVNFEFFPPRLCTPDDTLESLKTDALRVQVPAVGRALLAMAYGQVPFKAIPPDRRNQVFSLRGRVYGSAGTTALVATHPMAERTFVRITGATDANYLDLWTRGVRLSPVLATDPYGAYEAPLAFGFSTYRPIQADAARFDAAGRVAYFKDASLAAQAVHRSDGVSGANLALSGGRAVKPILVSTFRCTPVALYNQSNPQTMKSFKAVQHVGRVGLSGPTSVARKGLVTFLPPDFEFFVGLMDGAPANENVMEYRAFMLGVDPSEPIAPAEPDVYGRGYLAADTASIPFPHVDAAASLLRTAEKRLALQKRHGMADKQMLGFHEQARRWVEDARSRRATNDVAGAAMSAGAGLAYAINNHPVIRQRISHAVVGILWYLGLLVPFVFFAEKLLFGFTDIRKQLLALGLIFVAVFALLRLFHPAFQMVRSSLVILLGFVILLLTLLVVAMVGGKFRQNLKDLRRREGQVEGADISRSGVVGTAFMLGLNNMRRRKVRTELTCVTLVLITFVMICFTSVSSSLVNVEYATGRSRWNGIMLRKDNYLPLDHAEIGSVGQVYGDRFPVATLRWVTPFLRTWGDGPQNAEFLIDREFQAGEVKTRRRAKVSAAVILGWNEPQFSGIDRLLLTRRGWFPRPPQTRAERIEAQKTGYKEKSWVILPDTAARELGLTAEDVDRGDAMVTIRGLDFEVLGIIDSLELAKLTGLDGRSILPYDLNRVQGFGQASGRLLVPEDVARLPGSQVMIVNRAPPLKDEEEIAVACSILLPREPYRLLPQEPELPGLDYRGQRSVVLEFLERSGSSAYYAVDGVSYYGSRKRARTVSGMLELIVPILLAALTVFNTMRGSVYERREEIYVYNAVGIAPNHVFFIFMAEALVYAVVGAMLGYLLSQATGRALTALGLTGGLNMDYSSIETIYASLAIVASVLLSTVLPARDAARLASPAETRRWDIPTAETDTMEFDLPFTFTRHDRVAVIGYFWRWLDAHGAGSSGPFFCAPPRAILEREPGPAAAGPVPALVSTVWLKPYDLGVSQRIRIALPTDPQTGEYVARIRLERVSGHVAAWQRTLRPFLGVVRKQFLSWRVTTAADRGEMYAEAKTLLLKADRAESPGASPAAG